jgi:N-methylhydantoinase B
MGAVIERIPDGVYHGSGWVDSDGYDVRNVPIEVTVEVRGDRVVVDYEGTGAQAAGGFNGSEATTLTSGRLPFLFYADSDIPHNQGCFDHIEVKAPKGSIANPEYPGSTSCATIVPSGMLHDAINRAMVEAVPDMVHAGTARCSNVPQFFGVDEQNGEEWSMMIFNNCGGSGATKEADGWPLLESVGAMGGQKALPIEQMELLYPFAWRRWRSSRTRWASARRSAVLASASRSARCAARWRASPSATPTRRTAFSAGPPRSEVASSSRRSRARNAHTSPPRDTSA